MEINYNKKFKKSFSKLNENIKSKAIEKIEIFKNDKFNPLLRNHALKGNLLGKRSINITGDFRVIFQEYPNGTYEFVDFIDIGSHSEMY